MSDACGLPLHFDLKNIDLQKWVIDPAKHVYNDVKVHWNAFGKKFEAWSQKTLPATWHVVATKIFSSLPIALVVAILPLPLLVVGFAGCYIKHIAYGPFSNEMKEQLFNGATLGLAAKSAIHLASFLATFNPLYAITSAVYGAASGLLFKQSNLVAQRM